MAQNKQSVDEIIRELKQSQNKQEFEGKMKNYEKNFYGQYNIQAINMQAPLAQMNEIQQPIYLRPPEVQFQQEEQQRFYNNLKVGKENNSKSDYQFANTFEAQLPQNMIQQQQHYSNTFQGQGNNYQDGFGLRYSQKAGLNQDVFQQQYPQQQKQTPSYQQPQHQQLYNQSYQKQELQHNLQRSFSNPRQFQQAIPNPLVTEAVQSQPLRGYPAANSIERDRLNMNSMNIKLARGSLNQQNDPFAGVQSMATLNRPNTASITSNNSYPTNPLAQQFRPQTASSINQQQYQNYPFQQQQQKQQFPVRTSSPSSFSPYARANPNQISGFGPQIGIQQQATKTIDQIQHNYMTNNSQQQPYQYQMQRDAANKKQTSFQEERNYNFGSGPIFMKNTQF